MFQKGQLLNRRPNVKQYANNVRDVQDDDDDDPGISSFARSKVDDDDEKFKNQNSDPDFIDNLLRKKGRQDSKADKSNNSSAILPSTPPPQSTAKKGDVSNTDPKKGQPTTQTNTGNKDTKQQTPAKPTTDPQQFQTPTQKTPQQQKPTQQQTPQAPQQPQKQVTPQPPQKQPQPQTPATKVVEPPQSVKPSAQKEEPKAAQPEEEPSEPQDSQGGPTVAENRPTFVRRNKNSQAIKDIVKNIKTIPQDNIIALEPKNNIEVSKQLSLRFAPQKEFTDQTFPPSESQVFQVFGKGPVEFKRYDLGRELETHSVVDPNDIVPGLKTSPLMQVLAAAAEQPILISKIMEDQVINEFGYYYVRLCIGGVWKYIILDNLLGYVKGEPVGATTTIDPAKLKALQKNNPGFQSEMWPFLIEKGFAKEYGSYEDAIANVTVTDFLQEVTGAPTDELTLDETFKLSPTDVALIQLPDGIYTLIGFDGKEATLRNPWGWNKAQPQGAQPEGEFKLPLAKVKGSNLFVSHYLLNNYHVSYNLKATHDAYSSFSVTVASPTTATFRLHQRDERYFRNNISKKYKYAYGRILIFDEQKEFVAEDFGQVKTLSATADLQQGKYTVVVILDFENDLILDSTMTYYGTSAVQITRNNYRDQPNLLAQLYANQAIEKGQKKQLQQVEEYTYETQHKLTVIAWKYNGPNPNKWTKDLSKQPNRQNLRPLTFVNQNDCSQLKVLTTEKLKELKLNSWQNAPSFVIDFTPTNNTYAVVFK